jgi:hypothetical protein
MEKPDTTTPSRKERTTAAISDDNFMVMLAQSKAKQDSFHV